MSKKITFQMDNEYIQVDDEIVVKFDDALQGENLKFAMKKLSELEASMSAKGVFKEAGKSFLDFCAAEKVIKQEATPVEPTPWDAVQYQEMLVQYPRRAKEQDGYDDHTVTPGWLNYCNVKDLLARYFITIHANHGKVRNWRDMCIGITSLDCATGMHLPMFDYDGKNIKTKVKKDVKQLQSKFKLGDATIFETRKGLHVYFFSDMASWGDYQQMLEAVNCCKGFRQSAENHEYAVLRVSAKYTDFDILPYKVVISPHRGTGRPGRKAALIQELLRQGQECGTHIASLYPQWAYYSEDIEPWRAAKGATKRAKKVTKKEYVAHKALLEKTMKYEDMYNSAPKMKNNYTVSNTWVNTTSTSTTGNW